MVDRICENIMPDLLEYCTRIRRYLHRYPELSFKEEKTATYILEELRKLGLDGKRVGKTGVYVVIDAGQPGPIVAFRADTDALPIQEENVTPYASTVPGVMHACGHDGHVAILLGLAAVLQNKKESVQGKVVLLFQPAEESPPGGALDIVNSGILQGVEAIFGLHLKTFMPLGTVGVRGGPLQAAVDNFKVEISGRGGHASMPHQCIDPIIIGSQLVNAWQTIISRNLDPLDSAVLTVGSFISGTAHNIIPEKALLMGTVRTLSETVRKEMESRFRQITEGICTVFGASVYITYDHGYPVLVSDENLTNLVEEAARIYPKVKVQHLPRPVMGGEDFAYYGRLCPTAYFYLGAGKEGCINPPHHSARFDFDEQALVIGVQVFLACLKTLWNKSACDG